MPRHDTFVHVEPGELQLRAQQALAPAAWDYYSGGADEEVTLAESHLAWSRLRLRPHVLRDVSTVSTGTTVLGRPVTMPLLVAPMAYQRMAHDDGERATARAAGRTGTTMVVSTLATVSLEEVAACTADPGWFQLYVHRDRGWTSELVRRAVSAGYSALVLTVDLPLLGHRRRDERNGFTLPPGLTMANVGEPVPTVEGSGLASYANAELDPSLTPDDIAWLTELSGLPVVVKGVLRGDDAVACVGAGAAGIVVSTHGGRQLDTAIATASALPEVVQAVAGRAEVYVDGGVRLGTDVLKALALGARAVLLGRPVLWGLAVGGEQGVVDVLEQLRAELTRAMALTGAADLAALTDDLVSDPGWPR